MDDDHWIQENKEKYERYLKEADDGAEEAKTFQVQRELIHHRDDVIAAARGAASAEMLKTTNQGFISDNLRLSQREILSEIPVAIASRKFEFELPNGPYHVDITLNGRSILFGGETGHVGCFDWLKGKKFFEVFPSQEVRDVCFLYDDTMNSFATSNGVFIQDKNGVQLHEMNEHKGCVFLKFLRQFWLLVSASESGKLTYSDVTDGKTIAQIRTKRGRPTAMAFNKHNGVVSLGHTNGVISFWTPNLETFAATMFAHHGPVTSIDFNASGDKFATSGCDGSVRIWDVRNFEKCYTRTHDKYSASAIAFSETGVLAVARGNRVEFFKTMEQKKPYLWHKFPSCVKSLKMVTFDDFAICGLENGIASVVVPGSGEPNIDSSVANPFETVHWRQEREVRGLLDKLPYDMITMEIGGPIRVGKPVDKQKKRTEHLEEYKLVKTHEKALGRKMSMEERMQMMKEEYNRQKIDEKLAKLKDEEKKEPTGPLRRFAKAKEDTV